MRIVLFAPEIPQNTGNVARSCAVTGAQLLLVRPLGFNLTDKHLKRSGLDYWNDVDVQIVDSLEEALNGPTYFFSTKGNKLYTNIMFERNACLVFGSETAGLPVWVHEKWPQQFYKVPMRPQARSLNLSNTVAIVLYEALRQHHFSFF